MMNRPKLQVASVVSIAVVTLLSVRILYRRKPRAGAFVGVAKFAESVDFGDDASECIIRLLDRKSVV